MLTRTAAILAMVGLCATAGLAAPPDPIVQNGSASFSSDLEANKTITLNSFDTTADYGAPLGQWAQLDAVKVIISFSGYADVRGDNDDPLKTANVNGRIIRTWALTGPGALSSLGTKTVQSVIVALGVDNGDGGVFDATGPDGTDFAGPLSFANEPGVGSPFSPAVAPYQSAGAGNVNFIVDVLAMVNDLQFDVSPDQWQLEVQNPDLTVNVQLEYDWSIVPEPASMSILALGGLGVLLRRRKK